MTEPNFFLTLPPRVVTRLLVEVGGKGLVLVVQLFSYSVLGLNHRIDSCYLMYQITNQVLSLTDY
ncbi:hypothetical protein IJ00_02680 [Calothrix sp. 336/3]|nr:hypothetical protein IJ00_02680 [Calothrix sp. 336/3]